MASGIVWVDDSQGINSKRPRANKIFGDGSRGFGHFSPSRDPGLIDTFRKYLPGIETKNRCNSNG